MQGVDTEKQLEELLAERSYSINRFEAILYYQVQYMILIVSSAHNQGPVTKDETIPYDENFVLTRRHLKMEVPFWFVRMTIKET